MVRELGTNLKKLRFFRKKPSQTEHKKHYRTLFRGWNGAGPGVFFVGDAPETRSQDPTDQRPKLGFWPLRVGLAIAASLRKL